jgi:hypothetical protein
VEGSCEHGDEPSGSIKFWEVFEWLHNWQLIKKGSAPCRIETSTELHASATSPVLLADELHYLSGSRRGLCRNSGLPTS